MLSALRWVNKNIVDYGGNPNNVLIFGESSGGNAVIDIGALRGSSGLYQHAISESGGAGNYLYYTNMSNALQASNQIVQQMNCTNGNSQMILACLRNCSIEDLITAYGYSQTQPIIDDYFFPFYPPLAILKGNYNQNLSIILGNNDYEQPLCFQVPDMNSTDAMSFLITAMGQKWAPIVADYFQVNNCSSNRNATNRCCNIIRLLAMNKMFDCNVQRIYNNLYLQYGQQKNLFWYHFNCNPGICPQLSIDEGSGICVHTAELPYVFGTISAYDSTSLQNCTWDNQSRIFSNQVISNWISTATIGKPLQQWSYYDPSVLQYFYITPYQNFSFVLWDGSCTIFDQIEQEGVTLLFGSNPRSSNGNINTVTFFIILFSMFITGCIHYHL
jgi:carboxylesterase type B